MDYKNVESWFRAARENPIKAAGLLLVATALVFLFSFASQGARRVAEFINNPSSIALAPPPEPEPIIQRSMLFSDWLDIQRKGDAK